MQDNFDSSLIYRSKGEKVTAKAHGGPIEIFGVTVAQVDDQVRLQAIDTWMDPLAMFRQIAPQGIVNKEPLNHKVAKAEAIDPISDHDGIKTAEKEEQQNGEHLNGGALDNSDHQHVSESVERPNGDTMVHPGACPFAVQPPIEDDGLSQLSGAETINATNVDAATNEGKPSKDLLLGVDTLRPEATDPTATATTAQSAEHQAQQSVDAIAHQGAKMNVDMPIPDPEDTVAVAGAEDTLSVIETTVEVNGQDDKSNELVAQAPKDAIDQHLESFAEQVHPHSKEVESMVQPDAGEAVAAPAESKETQETHDEMSQIAPEVLPLLMNRE